MPADDLLDFLDPPEVQHEVQHVVFESVATEQPRVSTVTMKGPVSLQTKLGPNNRRSTIFFDLETAPDYDRADLFGLDAIPSPAVYLSENESAAPSEMLRGTIEDVKAAIAKATYSGKKLPRVVVEAAIKMERAAQKPRKGVVDLFQSMLDAMDGEKDYISQAAEDLRKTMSITPEFCRIISFAWAVNSDPTMSWVVGDKSADGKSIITERDVLAKFWELVRHAGTVVGYNILGFDLPVVFVRSILLGVEPSRKFDMKPWGTDVYDVMAKRFPKGSGNNGVGKLKNLAPLMGIKVAEDVEDVDGGVVGKLYEAGDYAKVGAYNRSDVDLTKAMWAMYREFWT